MKAKIQLVKDYGLILQIETNSSTEASMTGFIVNDQKANAEKPYKVGETLKDCVILDIDPEKKIVDLSERLAGSSKATVEESKKPAAKKAKQEAAAGF